jgi:hypothetical protein
MKKINKEWLRATKPLNFYVSTDSWHLLGSSPAGYREPYLVSWREEGAPTWHQQEQELLPGDMPTLRIGSCLFHLLS